MEVHIIPEFFEAGTPARIVFQVTAATSLLVSVTLFWWGEDLLGTDGARQAKPYSYGLTAAFLIVATIVNLVEMYEAIRNHGSETLMSSKSFWWALGGAAAFYWTRGLFPVVYGLVEVAIGIAGLIVASTSPALTMVGQVVALAAGAYVIVRGLDNIDRGLSPPLQRVWRSVWQFPKEQPPLPDPLTAER